MAALNFNAQEFESQRLPDPLPEPAAAQNPPGFDELTENEKSFMGMHSAYASVGFIDTPEKAKRHVALNKQEREQAAALVAREDEKAARIDPIRRAERAQARLEHQSVVNAANVAWRNAVAERARIQAEQDAIVKRLHDEFKRLKEMKV